MKFPRACRQCRATKRRCIRDGPGEACGTCQRKGLACEGDLRHGRACRQALLPRRPSSDEQVLAFAAKPAPLPTQSHPSLTSSLELPQGMAVEMVEHYLERINNGRPYSIFHPATLRAQVQRGTMNQPLLFVICAIGAKFSANPDVRAWESRLIAEAKRLLQLGMEDVCLEHIQACILISTMCVDLSNSSEVLYHRIASAMADVLNLNSPAQDTSMIVAEMKRRAWWACYLAENWCVSGLRLLSPIKHAPIVIALPMDEADFLTLPTDQSLPHRETCRTGCFAELLQLSKLFTPIQDLNRRVASGETGTSQLDREVEVLAQQLDEWKRQLPPDIEMSWENLDLHQERGVGGSFVLVHLTYHYYATLLYFRFLEQDRGGDQQLTANSAIYRKYVDCCKMHASSFSALLRRARQRKGCEPNFPLIGHMTTVSSSVLVHTLLFGDVTELRAARQELQANFEALIDLVKYWPGTSTMIARLVMFQNTCLLSTELKTHRLDGWMLRYLLERSLAGHEAAASTPVIPLDLRRESDDPWLASRAKAFSEAGRYMSFM
ncbi:fungal-specific transcription factor domain-containing protein [Microdochium trichocladiopsis]|uniref:Fungal-specific transcription factor domain-containing protein n=1 Tax=Microdochium trichocladiopsis TaxID=1682393 RepID=A0A9P8XY00_9PEZI|nr:fungal-specific transcription factor domain-containing protein [Microdochium trichocladiopsis]KAH7024888.1 fungal-specific transcription factor domain-containing protein [Microdochium trichocladiopsis]